MPNHVHAVLLLTGETGGHAGPPLHRVVAWFKTMTTNEYVRNVKTNGWTPFDGRLWQRGYYDRVVRNESELARIRDYIITNPQHWATDEDRPA